MARQKYIKEVSYERVRELFDYNPETGEVTRLKTTKPSTGQSVRSKLVGKVVRSMSKGYLNVKIDGYPYRLHRIIWLWYYGSFPEHDIDHINRDRADNRIDNLREVSRPCNVHNGKVRSDTSTGITGVSKSTDRKGRVIFRSHIEYKGRVKHNFLIDSYDFVEAVAHRLAAEQCLSDLYCNCKSSAEIFMENYLNEINPNFRSAY